MDRCPAPNKRKYCESTNDSWDSWEMVERRWGKEMEDFDLRRLELYVLVGLLYWWSSTTKKKKTKKKKTLVPANIGHPNICHDHCKCIHSTDCIHCHDILDRHIDNCRHQRIELMWLFISRLGKKI